MGNSRKLFSEKLVVLNVGLELFYDAMVEQKIEATQVVWQLHPVLDKRLAEALDRLL